MSLSLPCKEKFHMVVHFCELNLAYVSDGTFRLHHMKYDWSMTTVCDCKNAFHYKISSKCVCMYSVCTVCSVYQCAKILSL